MTSRDLAVLNRMIDVAYWHDQGFPLETIATKLGLSKKYIWVLIGKIKNDPKIRAAVELRKAYEKEKLDEADQASVNQNQKT